MKQQYLLAVMLCTAISSAHATAEAPLEIMIVTGTRVEQPLKQSLTHTTVITRQEIENSQAADVPSILKVLAGVELYQNSGIGKQSSLFLRGTNSSHVLVLLDGVRINSATAGTTQIDQLMLDQIERIEVVRGNVSSLYGSEAIGGVIQLFTKRGKGEPSLNVSAGIGTHGSKKVGLGFGGEAGMTAYNLQVSNYRTEGVSAVKSSLVPTVNTDDDGYENTSVSANVSYDFSHDHNISASLFDSDAHNQTDNSFGLSADVNTSKSRIQKVSLASDNRFSADWESHLQLSRGVDESRNFLNGVPDVALGAQFKTTSDLLSWQNTLSVDTRHTLIAGLEKLKQRLVSDTSFSQTSRSDDSFFAGYVGQYGGQQMQMNLRRDRYSDFGTANTWLLGYGIEFLNAWRVSASMATAFKAPTLNDLFYPFVNFGFGFSYEGNPSLKPERSRNNEIGVHYSRNGQQMDVVYFDNRTRDLIATNNLPASTVVNLNEARSDGVEFVYSGQYANTEVRLAATAQNPRDTTSGQTLLRRAKTFANIGVAQNFDSWTIGAEWQYSGKREDIDINTFARTTLPSYSVVNFTASHNISKQLKLSLRVDNLLNKDYMLAHGYNTMGRTLLVGFDYQQ